jgi:hypothetical protein
MTIPSSVVSLESPAACRYIRLLFTKLDAGFIMIGVMRAYVLSWTYVQISYGERQQVQYIKVNIF